MSRKCPRILPKCAVTFKNAAHFSTSNVQASRRQLPTETCTKSLRNNRWEGLSQIFSVTQRGPIGSKILQAQRKFSKSPEVTTTENFSVAVNPATLPRTPGSDTLKGRESQAEVFVVPFSDTYQSNLVMFSLLTHSATTQYRDHVG